MLLDECWGYSMKWSVVAGYGILMLVFGSLAAYMIYSIGWKDALCVWGGALIMGGLVIVGTRLALGEIG